MMTKAYLLGALHDGTVRMRTSRIAQKDKEYIDFLQQEIILLGYRAWTYKEGSSRNLYIVEFSAKILKGYTIQSQSEKIDYIRGYFDAEGGVPRNKNTRYYIYFAQKDKSDLQQLRDWLVEIDIHCGVIHNPSKKVDPHYWRFFIRKDSYEKFAYVIGSWHPIKRHHVRTKI
jgi:intein-encoded DNA endonuclease-like protein